MTRPPMPGDRVRISINLQHELHGLTGMVTSIDDSDILPYAVLIDGVGENAYPTYFDASELTVIEAVTNLSYAEDAGQ